MKYFVQNIKNNVDFFLRQHLKFSRKNYFEKNEPKEGLFGSKDKGDKFSCIHPQKALEKEEYLFKKFELDYLKTNSTKINYLENLYTIDLLDRYLDIDFRETLNILDIGCKNWSYAKGEYFFFKKYCEKLNLEGIELDANRLYLNFYSRKEVAKFHIKDLKDTKYIEKDFLKHDGKYDYIIWILPFIVEEPLLKWGLPKKYFQPEKMLMHAYNSLNKDGIIFIINQGETEYKVQKELCEKLNIPCVQVGAIKSEFLSYKNSRYLTLIKN